ncbi:MAG: ABC transporter substrate-binding protein [Bacteroidetes bacterium]|nr:ABC transporter substrate-binding protein [Bacteroidota bacterium]
MKIADQLGNTLSLSGLPNRIISIVPSQTELLFELGLDEEVVGITKYCIHPKNWNETKTIIGGTKKLNIEKIKELNPNLIIGNKEENEKSQIEELINYYPVWMSDIKTLEDALGMIDSIGKITGKEKKALGIQNDIREQFSHFKLSSATIKVEKKRVAYFIWRKPYICAGANTFINHMLSICGLETVFSSLLPSPLGEGLGVRYPEVTSEEIQQANPSLIFLSSEPYPFQKKHIEEFQKVCPKAQIILVNGEMFSWYGSRLLYAPAYFQQLLLKL